MNHLQHEPPNSARGELSLFGDRLLAGWEIVSITISFLMAEWLLRPSGSRDRWWHAAPLIVALTFMILSHVARRETLRTIGFRLDNFWPAIKVLLLPTLGLMLVVGSIGWYLGGFVSDKWREWQWLLWLPLWALVQQYALQGFIYRRAEIVFGRTYLSILVVALIFAVLHLPNPWFAGATFIGGLLWAATYQRAPNLFALSLSHSLLSLTLVWALPGWLLSGLRVGIRYFL